MDLGLDTEELEAWRLLNDYREANGRARLVWTPSLVKSSLWMANDLSYVVGALSHTDRGGRFWSTRIRECGYTASAVVGENIASGYVSGAQVFQGWKNSPGHNYVMLLPEFRVGGLSRAYRAGSTWGWYWALDLGGAAEPIGLATVHPETTWRWTCRSNLCERIAIEE